MKTISIAESAFEAIETSNFTFTVDEINRGFEQSSYPAGIDDDGEVEYSDYYTSFVAGEATAKHGELEIKFWWVANGGNQTYSDAFDFTIEIDRDGTPDFETNFFITDDDFGFSIEGWPFGDILREKLVGGEWEQLVQDLLPTADIKDIDVDEDSDMETFTLEIDNAPSVRFTGELVASAASSDNQAMGSSYSGQTGRWTELALYKTKGGKFVCHQVGRTRWQGERDRFSGKVCETLAEVQEFFGHRWLAKELYAEAGIDDAVEVE